MFTFSFDSSSRLLSGTSGKKKAEEDDAMLQGCMFEEEGAMFLLRNRGDGGSLFYRVKHTRSSGYRDGGKRVCYDES